MRIDIQSWFGSVSGEADTVLGQIIIMLLLLVILLPIRRLALDAVKALKHRFTSGRPK